MEPLPIQPAGGPTPHRLLVRGANWVGDAVMTTPALQRLREALPETHITLLTRSKLAELWKAHPALDDVVCIEQGESVWKVGRKLRPHAFDTALVFPNSPRSALEMFLAGIPRRIGYRRPWRNWFLTEAVPSRPGQVRMHKRRPADVRQLIRASRPAPAEDTPGGKTSRTLLPTTAHQTYDYLHLSGRLGAAQRMAAPHLAVTDPEVAEVCSRFDIARDQVWVGINAGAEYGPAKRWPPERFAAAARSVQQRTGCGLIVFGGPGDAEITERLVSTLQPTGLVLRNVSGRTSLRELMALLSCCRVLLTNDTGPMHLAAALGSRVVVPFGSTSPELTGPGLPGADDHRLIRSDVPCAPCFLRSCPIDFRCLQGVAVEQIVTAALDVLEPMKPERRS